MSAENIVEFRKHQDITIGTILASKVLDALNVTEFGEEVMTYINAHKGLHLLLNFEHVHYLSSAVLTELLRVKEAAEEVGGGLRLCGLREDIQKVFAITNLDKVFIIERDVEHAITRFKRSMKVEEESDAWSRLQKDK